MIKDWFLLFLKLVFLFFFILLLLMIVNIVWKIKLDNNILYLLRKLKLIRYINIMYNYYIVVIKNKSYYVRILKFYVFVI